MYRRSRAQFPQKTLIAANGTSEYFEYVSNDKKVSGETYYLLDADAGTIKVSDDGNWKLKAGAELPYFKNRYDKSGNQNRFGNTYVVPEDSHGMTVTERYDADYSTKNESGLFYYEYDFVTASEAGVEYFYRVGAAVRTKIQDATGTEPQNTPKSLNGADTSRRRKRTISRQNRGKLTVTAETERSPTRNSENTRQPILWQDTRLSTSGRASPSLKRLRTKLSTPLTARSAI